MVLQLTYEEVLKVCKNCKNFDKENQLCNENSEAKTLLDKRKCPKWDDHFGYTCIYRG